MTIAQEIHQVLSDYAGRYDDLLQEPLENFPGGLGPYQLGVSRSPALEFARETNLYEIMGHYRFPEGIKYGELQDYITVLNQQDFRKEIDHEDYMHQIERLWSALADINPHLEEVLIRTDVKGETERQKILITKKRAAIIGIEDGFNIKDINRYLDEEVGVQPSFNAKAQNQSLLQEMKTMVQNRVAAPILWQASFETMNYIFDKAMGRSPAIEVMHPGQSQKNGQDNRPVFKRKTRKDLGM